MYLFFSSLSSATAHKASVSFSKGGREGVLEHNCGLWTSVVLALGLLGGVGSESGFLSYLPPWLKVQGTRTSNCSWRPQLCPCWAVVEAAASGLAEHILLLASPWESCFYTCHLQVNLILPKIHVLLILYKITNSWPKI